MIRYINKLLKDRRVRALERRLDTLHDSIIRPMEDKQTRMEDINNYFSLLNRYKILTGHGYNPRWQGI